MVDQIEMALDDIIKANKKGGGGAGRKFTVNRKSSRGTGGGVGSGPFRNGRSSGAMRGRNRGGVSKASNYTRGDVNSTWKHDMFNDFAERKIQRGGGAVSLGPTKLLVSNLDFGVSDSDIRVLFSECGILKSAAVHYDRSGRSLGTADVVFERKTDALKAMKQYNGVPLDGRAMNIQLATSEITSFRNETRPRGGSSGGSNVPVRRNSNRGGVSKRNTSSRGGPRGGARRGRGGAGRGRRPVPTAEQLDAELDAYVKEIK